MWRYILKRLATGLVTLVGITIITFGVMKMAPGDPAQMQIMGIEKHAVSPKTVELLRSHYHLDKPLHVQYLLWAKSLLTFDLGNSFRTSGGKVSTLIGQSLWPTASIALLSMALAFVVAIPIGILCAVKEHGWFDPVVSTLLYMLFSVPSYVMAVLLILFVGVRLDWLPFNGMHSDEHNNLTTWGRMADLARHSVLITFCCTFGGLAYLSRFVRGNLLEVIRQDYIRTARAKGVRERTVVLKHAFRNSLIPLVTMLGMMLPDLIAGSVIMEKMFNWPGLGRLFYDSLQQRDYPVLMALMFFSACLVLLGNLLADLAYTLVDPRIRHE